MVYTDYNFLMADSERELHQFAKQIGISLAYFHKKPFPYYDLSSSGVKEAIRQGAQSKTTVEMVQRYFRFHISSE